MTDLFERGIPGYVAEFAAVFFNIPSRSIDRVDIDSINCRLSRGIVSRWIPAVRAIAAVIAAGFEECIYSLRWPDDDTVMVENIQVGRVS